MECGLQFVIREGTRVAVGGVRFPAPFRVNAGEFVHSMALIFGRPGVVHMKLQPLGDRLVVEREEAQDKTAGGIVLPDTAKDKPQKGKVLAIGDGRVAKDGKRRPLQVKVGDHVLFTSYAGDEFKVEGDKKVLLMREDDVLAVIEK